MKVDITKEDLGVIQLVNKVSKLKANQPVLTHTKFEVKDDTLFISSHNGISLLETSIAVENAVAGVAIVPNELLRDITKPCSIYTKGDEVFVSQGKVLYKHRLLSGVTYPNITFTLEGKLKVTVDSLASAVEKCLTSVGVDLANPSMNGIYWVNDTDKGSLFVSTDGVSLCVVPISVDTEMTTKDINFPIPFLQMVGSLCSQEKITSAEIKVSSTCLRFVAGKTTFTHRKLGGVFPNWKKPFSADYSISIPDFNGSKYYEDSLPLVNASGKDDRILVWTLSKGNLTSYTGSSISSVSMDTPVTYDGETLELRYNAKKLSSIMKVCGDVDLNISKDYTLYIDGNADYIISPIK